MYQSPPTRLPAEAGRYLTTARSPGQVERLVVQRQDGPLQLQRDMALLRKLRLEDGPAGSGLAPPSARGADPSASPRPWPEEAAVSDVSMVHQR